MFFWGRGWGVHLVVFCPFNISAKSGALTLRRAALNASAVLWPPLRPASEFQHSLFPFLICSCILSVITWVFTKEASDLAMMKWAGIDGIISDKNSSAYAGRNKSSWRWFTLVLTAPCAISFIEQSIHRVQTRVFPHLMNKQGGTEWVTPLWSVSLSRCISLYLNICPQQHIAVVYLCSVPPM